MKTKETTKTRVLVITEFEVEHCPDTSTSRIEKGALTYPTILDSDIFRVEELSRKTVLPKYERQIGAVKGLCNGWDDGWKFLLKDDNHTTWKLKVPVVFAGLINFLLHQECQAYFFGEIDEETQTIDVEHIYPCFDDQGEGWFDRAIQAKIDETQINEY